MARPAPARDPCRQIAGEVRAFCARKADPERAKKWARFFTEGYNAYGVDHHDPEWDRNRRAWGERLKAAGPTAFLDTGDLLVKSGKYEEASFAILFAADAADRYTPVALARIARWFDGGIRNWGHTDILCGEVLGKFLKTGIAALEDVLPWRESPSKFLRRALPVTLMQVLDQTRDYAPLFAAIEPLMSDRERVVQQGVGWFLREAWKRRPKPAEAFLLRYRDTAPRLIFQYATRKMDQAGREKFRRGK